MYFPFWQGEVPWNKYTLILLSNKVDCSQQCYQCSPRNWRITHYLGRDSFCWWRQVSNESRGICNTAPAVQYILGAQAVHAYIYAHWATVLHPSKEYVTGSYWQKQKIWQCLWFFLWGSRGCFTISHWGACSAKEMQNPSSPWWVSPPINT